MSTDLKSPSPDTSAGEVVRFPGSARTRPVSAAAPRQSVAATIVSSTSRPSVPAQVTFERRELDRLLRIYGFMVADGAWRDYAMDFMADRAVFSVYRRSAEAPLFRIEKVPKLARRQGMWAVHSQSGQVLKRGHDLAQVLKVFDRRLKLVK